MSNSDASVALTARWPMTELALVDPAHRVVAKAVGHLTATVASGLYELRTISGRQRHKKVVNLRGGESYVDSDVYAPFTPVAPVTEADRPVAAAVAGLSGSVTSGSASAAALVVVLRGRLGQDLDPAHVELVGGDARAFTESTDGCAGWSRPVGPGSHILRYHIDAKRFLDVPVWAQEGLQTVVFVPCPGDRPDPADAVTHLRSLTAPWTPDPDTDMPLELLLQGLTGRGIVPENMGSSRNPMLVLAHAATLAINGRGTAEAGFDKLMKELEQSLPGHPDVAALRVADRTRSARPASTPPTLAPLLWRVLLPADHDGLPAVARRSLLEDVIPVAVPNGPWLAWRQLERSAATARQRVDIHRQSLRDSDGSTDAQQIARAVGLTANCVRGLVLDVGVDRFTGVVADLIDELSVRQWALTVPGRVEVPAGDMTIEATLTDPGMARLRVGSRRTDVETYLAGGDVPVLVSGPDGVQQLVALSAGTAAFPADRVGTYRLRLGRTGRTGGHTSYEAVSFDPQSAPRFGTEPVAVRQRTVVDRGQFELEIFEDSSHGVQLAARSHNQVQPHTFVLASVRFRRDGKDIVEDLAVPLTWMAQQGVASGALRLGPLVGALAVFVVPDLVDLPAVAVGMLRRSLQRFGNIATRQALARAVDLVAEQENDE